ncbi:hypothetical protein Cni_G26291 [Canna indica]|uniref:Uncharacterized protein n=1 Tax=Canna indica TaxID=4628 RepID=A0AAQ3L2M5_9LILI|nr:hypothetical protein Cni_G26291 [Canna indica]
MCLGPQAHKCTPWTRLTEGARVARLVVGDPFRDVAALPHDLLRRRGNNQRRLAAAPIALPLLLLYSDSRVALYAAGCPAAFDVGGRSHSCSTLYAACMHNHAAWCRKQQRSCHGYYLPATPTPQPLRFSTLGLNFDSFDENVGKRMENKGKEKKNHISFVNPRSDCWLITTLVSSSHNGRQDGV